MLESVFLSTAIRNNSSVAISDMSFVLLAGKREIVPIVGGRGQVFDLRTHARSEHVFIFQIPTRFVVMSLKQPSDGGGAPQDDVDEKVSHVLLKLRSILFVVGASCNFFSVHFDGVGRPVTDKFFFYRSVRVETGRLELETSSLISFLQNSRSPWCTLEDSGPSPRKKSTRSRHACLCLRGSGTCCKAVCGRDLSETQYTTKVKVASKSRTCPMEEASTSFGGVT